MRLAIASLFLSLLLLPAGTAFVPMMHPRQHAAAAAAAASISSRRSPPTHLASTPEPLATEGDWTAYLDQDSTGLVYYFNGKTGESRWVPPTASFPSVTLPRKLQRQAQAKQEEYRKATVKLQEKGSQQRRSSFLSSLEEQEQQQQPVVETKKREQDDWFSGLLTTEKREQQQQQVVEETKEEKKEQDDWFSGLFKTEQQQQQQQQQQSTGTVVDEPPEKTTVEKQQQRQEQGGGGGFVNGALPYTGTGTGASGATTVEEEEVTVEKREEEEEMKESFFDKIMVGVSEWGKVEPKEIVDVEASAYVLPDPKKIFWGGEDAVFCKGRTFGVFDGVSGAVKLDGVPLYSKTLATEMQRKVNTEGLKMPDLTKLLASAVQVANEKATGASTAIVASIGEDGYLRALNVGDSACIVIRDGQVVVRSREINHFYECPYQFSEVSPDRPSDGTKLNFELVKGDMIVMGSDGIFDNLSNEQVVDVVLSSPRKASTIAKRVGDKSRQVSFDPKADTPHARLAQKNGNPDYPEGLGGKIDDVSCVVVCYG